MNGLGDDFEDISEGGVDSPHTITANGDATQIKTAPGPFADGVGSFDGTGDTLSIPDSDDWSYGSDDFTMRAWVRWEALSSTQYYFYAQGNSPIISWYHDHSTNELVFFDYNGSSYLIEFYCSWTPVIDTWYHIELVRDGNTWYMFINGESQSLTLRNGSYSATLGNYSSTLYINSRNNSTGFHNGQMCDFEVSATARHTSNFTPPSRLSSDSDTKLLLPMTADLDGSTTFTDSSGRHTVTANGDAAIRKQVFSPFECQAGSFDGTGDYLSVPDSSDWDLGTGDATIRTWVYFDTLSSSHGIFTLKQDQDNRVGLRWNHSNNKWVLYALSGASPVIDKPFSDSIAQTGWYYICLVKNGSTYDFYRDGVKLSEAGTDGAWPNLTADLDIGRADYITSFQYLDGKMADFEIIKGTAITDFSAPTERLTKQTNTVLLVPMNSLDPDGWEDISDNAHTITANGDAFIESGASDPYVDGCGEFDGTGDYLSVPDSDDWDFGSGDFTVEFFLRSSFISDTWDKFIVGSKTDRDAGTGWAFAMASPQNLGNVLFWSGVNQTLSNALGYDTGPDVNDNTWRHIAVSRDGNTYRLFVDGTMVDTNSESEAVNADGDLYVGSSLDLNTNRYFPGYLGPTRISKGIDLYTSNFTPPNALFVGAFGGDLDGGSPGEAETNVVDGGSVPNQAPSNVYDGGSLG